MKAHLIFNPATFFPIPETILVIDLTGPSPVVKVCAWHDTAAEGNRWAAANSLPVSHGICKECAAKQMERSSARGEADLQAAASEARGASRIFSAINPFRK